jgi:hypothetical protein
VSFPAESTWKRQKSHVVRACMAFGRVTVEHAHYFCLFLFVLNAFVRLLACIPIYFSWRRYFSTLQSLTTFLRATHLFIDCVSILALQYISSLETCATAHSSNDFIWSINCAGKWHILLVGPSVYTWCVRPHIINYHTFLLLGCNKILYARAQ